MRLLRAVLTIAAATLSATALPAPDQAARGRAVAEVAPAPHVDSVEVATRWAAVPQAYAVTAVAPASWCGSYGAADDLANEVPGTGPKFHLVIAVPHDVAVEPAYELYGRPQLADDAFRTVKTVEAFHLARTGISEPGGIPYGWMPRFDYGTACGAQFPDVSFYELPRTQAAYGTASPALYFTLTGDLAASGLYAASNKRYLVHYVGRNATACGESYIYDPADAGGARWLVVYNFLALGLTPAAGALPAPECGWTTDAHEIGHSMGAATGGPRNTDGAHTWDCWNDTMSYAAVTAVCGDGAMYYDFGHDNYLGHGGSWYDTRYSAYWCKTVVC